MNEKQELMEFDYNNKEHLLQAAIFGIQGTDAAPNRLASKLLAKIEECEKLQKEIESFLVEEKEIQNQVPFEWYNADHLREVVDFKRKLSVSDASIVAESLLESMFNK